MKALRLKLILVCALLPIFAVAPTVLADWNVEDPYKWYQSPDLTSTGIDICVDDTGDNGQRTIGDDFLCTESGPITDVHFWGSWRHDDKGQITAIHISFYTDDPVGSGGTLPDNEWSMPDKLQWERWFDASQFVERLYYTMPDGEYEGWWDPRAGSAWVPDGDTQVWQYNIDIPEDPFMQEGTADEPIIYWLVIEVKIDQTIENTSFGWKTRYRWTDIEGGGHFMDDAVWYGFQWVDIEYPEGHEYYSDSVDMAFVLTSDVVVEDEFEYGDAPEGANAIAYPSTSVTGSFPTCKTIGPAGYIEHNNFGAYFGQSFDFETDGNAGGCPGCFPPYDQDECFQDGDAGLIMPDSFTIDSLMNVVTCSGLAGTSLGQTCNMAVWGTDIDIQVHNTMPNHPTYLRAYINVLVDWNQDGQWGGVSSCILAGAPEHVLQNFSFPAFTISPLSAQMPAATGFLIGPNPGYVWARFSITEQPVTLPWDGSGIFEDGETEDYLLLIDPPTTQDIDWGDAPDGAAAPGYPTRSANSGANHTIDLTQAWLGTQTDAPDAEPDGQPDATATGDDVLDGNDDENGVVFPLLVSGTTVNATVDVYDAAGGGGIVEIWIDWDISTSWEAAELVFSGFLAAGTHLVPITVPGGLTAGQSFARCRISQAGTGSVTGNAPDGEVEDYMVDIEAEEEPDEFLKFQQLPLDGLVIDQFVYYGHDELSTAYTDTDLNTHFAGCYMADDFADLADTPVIKVKWWGSYIGNEIMEPITRFLVAFESDIPAQGHPGDPDYVPSHPGEVILSQFVHLAGATPMNPGEYSETYVNGGGPPCYEALYKYEAVLENPFPQEPDTVYWIKIVAMIDDPAVWSRLYPVVRDSGLSLCDFLKLSDAEQASYGLELPVTRWGWHNRDYTQMNPYASTAPAVKPGEHNPRTYDPTLTPIGSLPDDQVWHFQDDAVSGEVSIDESPGAVLLVLQLTWIDEYYRYALPYCAITQGVDGPDEIEAYSKDLAFELWTKTLTCTTCRGDWNGDGVVDLTNDLQALAGKLNMAQFFLGTYAYTQADIVTFPLLGPWNPCGDWNSDGTIDLTTDLQSLAGKLNMAKFFYGVYSYPCNDPIIDP